MRRRLLLADGMKVALSDVSGFEEKRRSELNGFVLCDVLRITAMTAQCVHVELRLQGDRVVFRFSFLCCVVIVVVTARRFFIILIIYYHLISFFFLLGVSELIPGLYCRGWRRSTRRNDEGIQGRIRHAC